MDHDHGMGGMPSMGNMMPPPSPSSSSSSSAMPGQNHHHDGHGGGGMRMMMMHMSFYWGKDAVILFDRWPGTSPYKYALALGAVFSVCVLVEWLSHCRLVGPGAGELVSGVARTAMHALRMGLAYVAMLAVMSFNVGVLLAAVAGHAVGFLVFGTGVLDGMRRRRKKSGGGGGVDAAGTGTRTTSCDVRERKSDLPPLSC